MTKIITLGFGTTILGTSYVGTLTHSSLFTFLMDMTPLTSFVRALLILVVGMYYFSSRLRVPMSRLALQLLGICLVAIGFTGLFTSLLSQQFGYDALPVDMFFAVNWGVVALLVSLDLPLGQSSSLRTIQPMRQLKAKKTSALPAATA